MNDSPDTPDDEQPITAETPVTEPQNEDGIERTGDGKIDLAKAYDWTKKYSYDPEGKIYIRSLPSDDVIDPKDDPELQNHTI